ncbi:hypothetical protein [Pseudobacteriovorax antillogorgiicola]|uniref:Uncharacterized protein n=1 Tax=Pseudobacteriovorax antillogorgiicola TaxID=1513793 RepID=A0A1Y6CKX6_9BACT|nr:hypothetical protein [Pseudobacteriovorax antillogorgiicola]TCS47671.1 hypothetical protein EDD56_120112 [Pseudobacteriovorax antillogorgiicola]SMF59634.1 hypothetical protein SAMN06296036_12028 [Pseudobacteriovorax antillogorgiicola]
MNLFGLLLPLAISLPTAAYGDLIPDVRLEVDFGTQETETQMFWYAWQGDERVITKDSRTFDEAFNFQALTVRLDSPCGFNYVERNGDLDVFFHNLTLDALCACTKLSMSFVGLPQGEYDIRFAFFDEKAQLNQTLSIYQKNGPNRKKVLDTQIKETVPTGPLKLDQIFFSSNGRDAPAFEIITGAATPILVNGFVITLYKDSDENPNPNPNPNPDPDPNPDPNPTPDPEEPEGPSKGKIRPIPLGDAAFAMKIAPQEDRYLCLVEMAQQAFMGEYQMGKNYCRYVNRQGLLMEELNGVKLIESKAELQWSEAQDDPLTISFDKQVLTPCLIVLGDERFSGYIRYDGACAAVDYVYNDPILSWTYSTLSWRES